MTLWIVQPSLDGLERYFALAEREPNFSLIRNKDEVHGSRSSPGRPGVAPVLEIRDPTFDLDYFEDGVTFVSSRLFAAMELPVDVASFQAVDATRCAGAVAARGYSVMHVDVEGDPVDPERSDGGTIDLADADGNAVSIWQLRQPTPGGPAPTVTWRDGYSPPADAFRIAGTGWIGASDSLAERVLAAGATGLNFVDVVASAASGEPVVRNRRR